MIEDSPGPVVLINYSSTNNIFVSEVENSIDISSPQPSKK